MSIVTMRCADETGWPEREFELQPDGVDHCCKTCGWYQISFAHGCRELVLSAEWHSFDLLRAYAAKALEGGLTIVGDVSVRIPASIGDEEVAAS